MIIIKLHTCIIWVLRRFLMPCPSANIIPHWPSLLCCCWRLECLDLNNLGFALGNLLFCFNLWSLTTYCLLRKPFGPFLPIYWKEKCKTGRILALFFFLCGDFVNFEDFWRCCKMWLYKKVLILKSGAPFLIKAGRRIWIWGLLWWRGRWVGGGGGWWRHNLQCRWWWGW